MPISPASARCADCITRRMPPVPRPPRWRSASIRRRSRQACGHSRGSRIAWRKSAAATPFCSSTIPRPPMPIRRRRRWPASTTFSGSPAASRKPAASNLCAAFFPRIRKAYLIGEAADEFAATLGDRGASRNRRHARQGAGRPPRAMPQASGAQRTGRVAVAGLRLVRPVPQFRGSRRRLPRFGAGAAGGDGQS